MPNRPLSPHPSARALREMARKRGLLPPSSPREARSARQAPQMPITLTLPLPPNMANKRWHWRVKERERRIYNEQCDIWEAMHEKPVAPLSGVTVSASIETWALMDDDNALARLKWAVDWLVTRGYLLGDSRKHITWAGIPEQVVSRVRLPRVTFTITPPTPGGA